MSMVLHFRHFYECRVVANGNYSFNHVVVLAVTFYHAMLPMSRKSTWLTIAIFTFTIFTSVELYRGLITIVASGSYSCRKDVLFPIVVVIDLTIGLCQC